MKYSEKLLELTRNTLTMLTSAGSYEHRNFIDFVKERSWFFAGKGHFKMNIPVNILPWSVPEMLSHFPVLMQEGLQCKIAAADHSEDDAGPVNELTISWCPWE